MHRADRDVRGRSHTLRINYRTSRQIRSHADRLLPPELADVDGNNESPRGTISVFNGVEPVIEISLIPIRKWRQSEDGSPASAKACRRTKSAYSFAPTVSWDVPGPQSKYRVPQRSS
jgi:hypothetical protein